MAHWLAALTSLKSGNFKQFVYSMKKIAEVSYLIKRHNSCKAITRLIKEHTTVCTNHLTPEIKIHLITPANPLWRADPNDVPFNDPFWAFYWPGGQSLARYILDNPETVFKKNVLDVGSGSGACAIAAAMGGAQSVTANDIDLVAKHVIEMNSKLNNVHVEVNTENLVGKTCKQWDCILCGDIFYDEGFAMVLLQWLKSLSLRKKLVLIGDPGRQALKKTESECLSLLAEYPLNKMSCLENSGFSTSCVWKVC